MITTATTNADTVRSPFGELHARALANCPPTIANSQRKDFLDGKPNVWFTLARHLQAIIDAGATPEQYHALIDGFAEGAHALCPPHPTEVTDTLADVLALDEAAEGVEDVAEIDALAQPSAGRLGSLYDKMHAAMTAKRRGLRVIARDFRRALQQTG